MFVSSLTVNTRKLLILDLLPTGRYFRGINVYAERVKWSEMNTRIHTNLIATWKRDARVGRRRIFHTREEGGTPTARSIALVPFRILLYFIITTRHKTISLFYLPPRPTLLRANPITLCGDDMDVQLKRNLLSPRPPSAGSTHGRGWGESNRG